MNYCSLCSVRISSQQVYCSGCNENREREKITSVGLVEIPTNLEKNGYALKKITWSGELHAPSLTTEQAAIFLSQK